MPTLVLFGAGNIGRGFVAPLFCGGGWSVTFIDVAPAIIAALNERRRYPVISVDNSGEQSQSVGPVAAIDGRDRSAVAAALADCDLAATSVGLGALPHLGAGIAAGLVARGERPLDILLCENGVQAGAILREAVLSHLPEGPAATLDQRLGLVRASIGRMIPPPLPGGDDPLAIRVEPYAHLPLDRAGFRGPLPTGVREIEFVDDFDLVLLQKLYLHNLSHAALAFGGFLKGLATIPDCAADPGLVARAAAAAGESSRALAAAHGHDDAERRRIQAEQDALMSDLLQRYGNRALADPVRRVARDPWRKLAGDDRLVGAARLCQAQGVRPLHLAHVILDACAYDPADDEPEAAAFRRARHAGWRALLRQAAQLSDTEPLMSTLTLADRQRQAAERIRAAGILLKDDEVATIEIADFGLKRYDEIGLAIHVYCNTKRCCAKELAMEPRQMCPEHLHPDVDGEPGKEETFRVRAGEMFLFLPGRGDRAEAETYLPADKRDSVSVFQRFHLKPGDQMTLPPNTKHWFVAGPDGCVVSEFSTRSRDEADCFTDPTIVRVPDEA